VPQQFKFRGFRFQGSSVALLAVAVLLGFTPLRLVSLLILVYVLARCLPIRLGILGKCIVAFVLFSCANAFLAVCFFIFRLPLSSALIISIFSLVLLAFTARFPISGSLWPSKDSLANSDDWLALLVAIVPVMLLLAQIFPHPSIANIAPAIMEGGDNSAHIEILKGVDANRGLTIGSHNRANLPSTYASYPQGWHYNGAFTEWLVEALVPFHGSATKLLGFYYLYCSLWVGLFSYILARLVLYIYAARRGTASKLAKLAPLLIAEIGLLGWLFPLEASGFQPQIGALTCLSLVAFFLIEAYRVSIEKRYPFLLLAGLAAVGTSLFWVFLAPIAIIALVLALAQTMYAKRSYRLPTYFIGCTVVVAFGVFFQIYIQYKNPANGGGFNAFGYVPDMLPMYVLLGILLGISLYMYFRSNQVKLRVVYAFALITIVFALVVMLIQSVKYGEPRYYYYKATYTYLLFAIILLAAIGGDILQTLLAMRPRLGLAPKLHYGLILISFVVIASLFFVSFQSADFSLYYNKEAAGITPAQATTISELYVASPANDVHVVPIGSCDRGVDIRVQLLAASLAWSPQVNSYKPVKVSLSSQSTATVFGQINDYLRTAHIPLFIVSSDQTLTTSLQTYLTTKDPAVLSELDIINLDSNPTATNAATCPARLGDS
jgi:hypothetical protein